VDQGGHLRPWCAPDSPSPCPRRCRRRFAPSCQVAPGREVCEPAGRQRSYAWCVLGGAQIGASWRSTRSGPVPITADLGMASGQPNYCSLNQRWKVRMLAGWVRIRAPKPALSSTNGRWSRNWQLDSLRTFCHPGQTAGDPRARRVSAAGRAVGVVAVRRALLWLVVAL